jgi:hypothetical protein
VGRQVETLRVNFLHKVKVWARQEGEGDGPIEWEEGRG